MLRVLGILLLMIVGFFVFAYHYGESLVSPPPHPNPVHTTVIPDSVRYGRFIAMPPDVLLKEAAAVDARWTAAIKARKPDAGGDDIESLKAALERLADASPAHAAAAHDLLNRLALRKLDDSELLRQLAAERVANDSSGRSAYASRTEEDFLKKGMDVTVRVGGKKNTTLTISYVLMGRPTVYNLINDPDYIDRLKKLGFKVVVFTDGYDHTWRINLATMKTF